MLLRLGGLLMLFVLVSCDESVVREVLFSQLKSNETGIDFVNKNVETDEQNILTYEYFYNGGGVAAGDINNDGLVDLFFTSNQGENKLYLNKGSFKFEDITSTSGVAGKSGWKTGAAMADINGDGFLDIYVCRSGNVHELLRHNSFYINKGNLTFQDKAPELKLDDASYSTQVAFLDFDNDSDLDIFLLNHSRLHISNSFDISRRFKTDRVPFVGNRLYKSENGKFREVSDSIGIYGPASNYGLGVAFGDINNDGWLDLYTSNDYTEKDKLLFNKNGIFSDASDSVLTQMSQFSMGLDIADINNDGLLDILTVDMLPETNMRQKEFFWPDRYDMFSAMVKNGRHFQYMRNMLHLNNGNGTFSEIGQLSGVSNTDWSWAPLIADFDNDGLQDIFISNGFKRNFTSNDFLKYKADLSLKAQQGQQVESMREILKKMPANAAHDYLFINQNGVQFKDRSSDTGFEKETLSNGAVYTDLDNDGDLDLVINRMDGEAGIYRNNSETISGNSFLKIRLEGNSGNSFGIGSKVTIFCGTNSMTRTLCPYRGFQSSVEPFLFFGLGKSKIVDSLIVEWPDLTMQKISAVKTNQLLTLKQVDAGKQNTYNAKPDPEIIAVQRALPFRHNENEFVDFKVQLLLPRMYSTTGPALSLSMEDKSGKQLLFAGGAKGQSASILELTQDGNYVPLKTLVFDEDKNSEDVDAVFFDMDKDGDEDLYVVSGGYEFEMKDKSLQDRLYKNQGNGKFIKVPLPEFFVSGSCVRPCDVDNDGDVDLFVGGRIVPGRYPEAPFSVFLENDGKGIFKPNASWTGGKEFNPGMITDAEWFDINKDNKMDLVVVGEYMPVSVYIQENGILVDKTTQYIKESTRGWWNCIEVADMDKDGDMDLIAGNFGLNNQYKPTKERPVKLVYGDYDSNGSVDLLLNYFIGDQLYPAATRDEIVDQVPSFKKKYPDYASYTVATLDKILSPEQLARSSELTAEVFESSYFRNNGSGFERIPLPLAAQFSPMMAISIADINADGNPDIIGGGNISGMGVRLGKATGTFSIILLGEGNGNFRNFPVSSAGSSIIGDVRKIINKNSHFYFGINNAPIVELNFYPGFHTP